VTSDLASVRGRPPAAGMDVKSESYLGDIRVTEEIGRIACG